MARRTDPRISKYTARGRDRWRVTPPPAPTPAPAPRDPWYDVTAKWRSVFGISVTTEDAELMVALANREIEKARREAID